MKNLPNKSILIWGSGIIIILVLVFVGALLATQKSNQLKLLNTNQTLSQEPNENDWSKGNAEAKVTIVEYSDFQCPACKVTAPVIDQVVKKYPDRVRLVFRHYPLPSHENADLAARFAESAGMQGKFWEMHDLLFAKQNEWSDQKDANDRFASLGESLGLDVEKLKTDAESPAVVIAVKLEIKSGNESGVRGTPSLFVNGRFLPNPITVDSLEAMIKAAEALPQGETTPGVNETNPATK